MGVAKRLLIGGMLAVLVLAGCASSAPGGAAGQGGELPTLAPRQWTEADYVACFNGADAIETTWWSSDGGWRGRFSIDVADRELDREATLEMIGKLETAVSGHPEYFAADYPPMIAKITKLLDGISQPMTQNQFDQSEQALFKGIDQAVGSLHRPCFLIREWLDANVKH